ncbi:MAG: CoA ester lyase, partial [Desulfobacterales bacterium]|nr:CoA ester lyase [Desulfobacterales bacterium]
MPIMRSVFYVPGNNQKMVAKAPTIACDILTLDLEDSVPAAEKSQGREMIQEYLKSSREKQLSPTLYVRVNDWETKMTNDDLKAVVHQGLDGVCLPKCGDAENVKRLD